MRKSNGRAEARGISRHWTADALLMMTATIWGANILVFKHSTNELNPWVFNAVRLVFASLTLGILAGAETLFWPRDSDDHAVNWRRVGLFSLLTGFVYLVIFVKAIALTTAGNTALILASMPMWTAIMSRLFLHERLRRITWTGLMVTFVGTAIVTTQGSGEVSLSSRYFVGNLLMLLASMTWAGGTVMSRSILQAMSPLRLAFISCVMTTPLHFLLAAPSLRASVPQLAEPSMLVAVVFSGAFSTGIAYACWHAGVRAVGGSHAAVYQNVVTLVAVIGGWLVLKEQPMSSQVIGGILTVVGLLLMRKGRG